jgi:hypothetical protein
VDLHEYQIFSRTFLFVQKNIPSPPQGLEKNEFHQTSDFVV